MQSSADAVQTPAAKRQKVKDECPPSGEKSRDWANLTPGQKKRTFESLSEAAMGETLPLHFLKSQQRAESAALADKHNKQYDEVADREATYLARGLSECSKRTYEARLGQLASRERVRAARKDEAELQLRLDIEEGEALMRELQRDEGQMSYWLHSHRRCTPPRCVGFMAPRCCPGTSRASSSS